MIELVREFHEKFGLAVDRSLESCDNDERLERVLADTARILGNYAKSLQSTATFYADARSDYRLMRIRLAVEELAEQADAMRHRDRVGLAHELADSLYVDLGTAVTFGIPIRAVLQEVHRSNMTKQANGPDKVIKGDGYKLPNVAKVLAENETP